jgi:hypothetical protein
VEDYLARGGESLRALRVAFQQDASLRELTETPLMLSILTLTYHDLPVEDLLQGGFAPARQQVFERYVERMLIRRGQLPIWMQEQFLHWLTFVANQLHRHQQTVFSVEDLQPDWLQDSQQRLYRGSLIVVFGLIVGLIGWLAYGPTAGLGFGLAAGLGSGLVFGRDGGSIRPAEAISWPWEDAHKDPGDRLVYGLGFGLAAVLGSGLVSGVAGGLVGLGLGLGFGMPIGLVLVLGFGLSTNHTPAALVLEERGVREGTGSCFCAT